LPPEQARKRQRAVDPAIYRKRNLLERLFNKLKHFRKIATRSDKDCQKLALGGPHGLFTPVDALL
jgi:transposase